jgi:hypothetical protein
MSTLYITLSEDEFDIRYPVISNHLNPAATWAFGDAGGCLFETYGEEFKFVRRQDPRAVWTLIDGDDGDQHLVSGCHFVNRIGYVISTTLVPRDVHITVRLPSPKDE